jgi:hypothetical protein
MKEFFYMHHDVKGENFDTLHKVFKDYYENALSDFDEMAEWTVGLGGNKTPFNLEDHTTECTPERAQCLIEQIVKGFFLISSGIGMDRENYNGVTLGLQNFVQGRLEYWGKELCYFNKRRICEEIT